ncbi:hypothetical protein RJ640_016141 [Escallonia rubra]|uniref:Uncharacterized protein n=1 Tax=Escallonia rubra TaxID=112253 RepID=A0AA88QWS4_9ASTE|nr:hypothetical protein RJ640_016141 [Escallonia rubra]
MDNQAEHDPIKLMSFRIELLKNPPFTPFFEQRIQKLHRKVKLPVKMSQPVEVYPNTVTRQQPSHNSNGSFGTVFIVLAVIIVISAIACFLGRLCNRRFNQSKANKQKQAVHPKEREAKQKHGFPPGDGGDIEFGFDKRMPSAKVAWNGEIKGPKVAWNGDVKGSKSSRNGEFRGEMRFPNGGDL